MTAAAKRLRDMCNRLALGKIRTARSEQICVFCGQPIKPYEEYRDAGPAARAHIICFIAVTREYKKDRP